MSEESQQNLLFELQKTNQLLKRYTSKKNAFLRGILTGLGASLGATILITLLLWTLSQLEFIPFVGELVRGVNDYLKQNVPAATIP